MCPQNRAVALDSQSPEKLSEFERWVKGMQQRWEERFSALDSVLEREKKKLVQDEQESR